MSSTNFRSILIFASCVLLVLVIYYMGDFLLGGVLFFVHYHLFSALLAECVTRQESRPFATALHPSVLVSPFVAREAFPFRPAVLN